MRRQLRVSLTLLAVALAVAVFIHPQPAGASGYNPLNPWRFGASTICLNNPFVNDLPSGSVAAEWSKAADINVVHDYGLAGCDGYSEATTIDIFYGDLGTPDLCVTVKYTYNETSGTLSNANVWMNTRASVHDQCFGTYTRRAHWLAQAVGFLLGLDTHANGNRSVMSTTAWSEDNVGYPEASDFEAIERRYPW